MSSTHLLLTLTCFFFPAPSLFFLICINETQGLSSNYCLSNDIISTCFSSLHEMLTLRSWYGLGDGVSDNDTGMTGFLTIRENSLTQGNLRFKLFGPLYLGYRTYEGSLEGSLGPSPMFSRQTVLLLSARKSYVPSA